MEKYLVSVIIPCYNVEKHLDRCLNSVVRQTYKNLEIILIDDGSDDRTPEMCDEWAKKDERIRVIHTANKGVSHARNTALDTAKGYYVVFIDSDDFAECGMIKALADSAVKNNADIAVCGYQINEEKFISDEFKPVKKDNAVREMSSGVYSWGVIWNKLYKKSVIEGIRMPDFACSEDLVFNYKVLKNASVIVKSNSNYYHYMQNENSIVHSEFTLAAFDALTAREIMFNDLKNTEFEKYAVRGLIDSCYILLSGIVVHGKTREYKEQYNILRNYVLKYKKDILSSDMYSRRDKIKAEVLSVSPKLFNKLILKD